MPNRKTQKAAKNLVQVKIANGFHSLVQGGQGTFFVWTHANGHVSPTSITV